MLKENPAAAQKNRRWFSDDYFDLIVWCDLRGRLTGFQLCYDKEGNERALTWSEGKGTGHQRIENGEASPLKNMTPVLLPDGAVPYAELARQFQHRAGEIDRTIYELVMGIMREGHSAQTAPD